MNLLVLLFDEFNSNILVAAMMLAIAIIASVFFSAFVAWLEELVYKFLKKQIHREENKPSTIQWIAFLTALISLLVILFKDFSLENS